MIHSKNSNPDVRILVLARPADSIYTLLPSFLKEQGYPFSESCTIYQALRQLEISSPHQALLLIARSAMLSRQALLFISKQYPALRIIGWCDPRETISDRACSEIAGYGIVQVSDLEQLQQILRTFSKSHSKKHAFGETRKPVLSDQCDRLKYELSKDEITALLGAE